MGRERDREKMQVQKGKTGINLKKKKGLRKGFGMFDLFVCCGI